MNRDVIIVLVMGLMLFCSMNVAHASDGEEIEENWLGLDDGTLDGILVVTVFVVLVIGLTIEFVRRNPTIEERWQERREQEYWE